jgi:DNA-binding MarR family transcriptional regulator
MTIAQLGLMAQIAVLADDTMGELANRAGLEQSTLSRNLRTLEAEGLIEIAVVETDLRRRAVWLTEAGARRLEAAIPIWRRAHARLSECISPDRVRKLADATQRLTRA